MQAQNVPGPLDLSALPPFTRAHRLLTSSHRLHIPVQKEEAEKDKKGKTPQLNNTLSWTFYPIALNYILLETLTQVQEWLEIKYWAGHAAMRNEIRKERGNGYWLSKKHFLPQQTGTN